MTLQMSTNILSVFLKLSITMIKKNLNIGKQLTKTEMKLIKGGNIPIGGETCPQSCDTLRDCTSDRKCMDCVGGGRACFRD